MRVIKSKDGFTNTQDMVGGRERCKSEIIIRPPWSRVKRRVRGTNQGTSNKLDMLGASYLQCKDLLRGTNKIMSTV